MLDNFTIDEVNVPEEVCKALNVLVDEINDINKLIQPTRAKRDLHEARAKAREEARIAAEAQLKAEQEAQAKAERDAENKAAEDARAKVRAQNKARETLLMTPSAIEIINHARNEASAKPDATSETIGQAVADAKEAIWNEFKEQETKD